MCKVVSAKGLVVGSGIPPILANDTAISNTVEHNRPDRQTHASWLCISCSELESQGLGRRFIQRDKNDSGRQGMFRFYLDIGSGSRATM